MIEILIKYIQDKGFLVDVHPGCLSIQKYAPDGQLCNLGWMISPLDLRYATEEILYWEATKRCDEIDKVIAERAKESAA